MTALIGIDWGSSNLRAFRFAADGRVIDKRTSPRGITTVTDGGFAAVLAETVAGWIEGSPPILLAGMIGSRNGWREAAYLACPADPAHLASALLAIDTDIGRCHIVPGLVLSRADEPADVMRGEETQVLGAGVTDGRVVLPGTHSKWVTLEGGKVTRFRTAMTGELYALLLGHSLLGRLSATQVESPAAFTLGAERALADPALSMLLFSARAEVLTGGMPGESVGSYLSGLLIGAEIGAMAGAGGGVAMIGDPVLAARYRAVMALAGIDDVALIDGDGATARGLWAIGSQL